MTNIENFRDARSVFRLTKSIFEVKRIKLITEKTKDLFAKVVNIISRGCYLVFWLLDNIYILLKLTDQGGKDLRTTIRGISKRF